MEQLVQELIPHAPAMGLYVGQQIPPDKLKNAIADYAKDVAPEEVLALYDATILGNARDGALFLPDRLVFENNDLQGAEVVLYQDIVAVEVRRRLLGGKAIHLEVNRGRATFQLALDFSGKPDAVPYVVRFLNEAMLHQPRPSGGDVGRLEQVRVRLLEMMRDGLLREDEVQDMMGIVRRGGES